ncbi:MAG: AAA family ATPase [Deltaproteobacteria bacterium]|nr:AAA family ATPase [Deltaproteobacteria bacterium]
MSDASLEHLPDWARSLGRHYLAGGVSTFVLHGNTRDLQPIGKSEGGVGHVSLRVLLTDHLFSGRDLILHFDRSAGLRADTKGQQQALLRSVEAYDEVHGTNYGVSLPRTPGRAFPLIESLLRRRVADRKRVTVVLDFAETLAPAQPAAGMSADDRYALVTLQRWAHDATFLSADLSIVLITEQLADLSPALVGSPYVQSISVPRPDAEGRRSFLRDRLAGRALSELSEVSEDQLVQATAGLSRIHLGRILEGGSPEGGRLDPATLEKRKAAVLAAEAHGLLEVVQPSHGLDAVAGHEGVKRRLRDAAAALSRGRGDVLPMGYLICGPVGTGKTFLATCFAAEVGVPCVKLKNFRSQWVGATEANLERILALLKAMWPVVVIVDEADAFLGDRDQGGDSGVGQRVFAAIASFMGNTDYRGKILWFLLTARPDLLPVDIKRQGRAEEHLPLFPPESPEEIDALFRALLKKNAVPTGVETISDLLPEESRLSGAELEAVIARAHFRAATDERQSVTPEDLEAVLADFRPPSYPEAIALQTLVAVRESTSREVLPEGLRDLDPAEVHQRIARLLALVD